MPSGKWSYRHEDTVLYFSELLVSRMRVCLERKEHSELHPCVADGLLAQLDGAASNEHRFVVLPRSVWKRIRPGVMALAHAAGVRVTYPQAYWGDPRNITVRFHAERVYVSHHRMNAIA